MFSVLSSVIKVRSASGTSVRSVDRLERRGGKGGFLTVVDALLI